MESIISRDTIRERGAAAIRDWQAGWHQRRVERSRAAGNQARMAVAA